MSYISGARSVADKQVKIASTKMDGIGPKKAIQVHSRLGISENSKIKELTKYQIDKMEQMIRSRSSCSLGIEEGRTSIHQMINFYFSLSWNSSSRWTALTWSTNSY